MISVGKYFYDSDRLIFIPSNLDDREIQIISNSVKENSEYNKFKDILFSHDSNAAKPTLNSLGRGGIIISDGCNLHCNYCGDKATGTITKSLRMEEIALFLKDLMKHWKVHKLSTGKENEPLEISITGGGEQTFNWTLFQDAVFLIKKKCIENHVPLFLSLTTNGILDDEKRRFISENIDKIMISYDGLPEIQNRNRISPRYPETASIVEESIRYFIEKNKEVSIRTTVWQDDFRYLIDMANYLVEKFGTSFDWGILPVIPMGRALNRIKDSGTELQVGFVKPYVQLLQYIETNIPKLTVTSPIFSTGLTQIFCGGLAPTCSCLWLTSDKKIVTCVEGSDEKTTIGEISSNRLAYYETCKDPLLRIAQQKYVECRECIAYRFCRGGCPAKHLMTLEHPNEMGKWECEQLQEFWMYVFTKILSGEKCFGWGVKPLEIDEIKKYGVLSLYKVDGTNDEVKQC